MSVKMLGVLARQIELQIGEEPPRIFDIGEVAWRPCFEGDPAGCLTTDIYRIFGIKAASPDHAALVAIAERRNLVCVDRDALQSNIRRQGYIGTPPDRPAHRRICRDVADIDTAWKTSSIIFTKEMICRRFEYS